MLYLSTRSRTDHYTAHRALHEEYAPDGGHYLPFQLHQFTKEDIRLFKNRSFGENVACILNIFFSVKLSGWDVEFCCGRSPIQLIALPHRLSVVELWHNASLDYEHMQQTLYSKLTGSSNKLPKVCWARIAINIAFMFAVYGEMSALNSGIAIDIAVDTNAFIAPVSLWYARQMGLPIGTIICGTRNHGEIWDLLHLGNMNTAVQTSEIAGIEYLIRLTLGTDEVLRYVSCCSNNSIYCLDDTQLPILNSGLFGAVVSNDRLATIVGNIYRSHGYVLDVVSAVSFSALQDYRARTGESKHTLIMSACSPVQNGSGMTKLLGITASELENAVNQQRG